MTLTEKARDLISREFSNRDIAACTGLHEAYVRKIRQRLNGNEPAWHNWRSNNPDQVREYRDRQNRNRKAARRA